MLRRRIADWVNTLFTRQLDRKCRGHKRQKQSSNNRLAPAAQQLEARELLTLISWDGGGDGISWEDSMNWDGDSLPGAGDEVVVGTSYADITIISGADVSIQSFTSEGSLRVSSGTFTIAADSTIAMTLILSVSTLTGTGTLTTDELHMATGASLSLDTAVGESFVWNGGTINGATVELASGSNGQISSSSLKILAGNLVNAGELTYDGSGLRFGVADIAGVLTNETGGTLVASGGGDASNFQFLPDNAIVNQGAFRREGAEETRLTNIRFDNQGSLEVAAGTLALEGGGSHTADFDLADGTLLQLKGTHTFAAGADLVGSSYSLQVDGGMTYAGSIATTGTAYFAAPVNIAGLVSVDTLTLGSNTTTLGSDLTARVVAINLGALTGTGTVTTDELYMANNANLSLDTLVGERFVWNGGTINGATVELASGSTGHISSSSQKILAGNLENAGKLTYDGSGLRFGLTGIAGVLTNEAGATLVASGGGDASNFAFLPDNAIVNQGTFRREGADETQLTNVRFDNQGSLEVAAGTLALAGGDLTISEYARFDTATGSVTRISGSIVGSTKNSDLFRPWGTTTIVGGNAATPRLLEVMSADLGTVTSAFNRNFAYGNVTLESSYVKLVDTEDNAFGVPPESVYIDTLVVPTGSTLDLNGYHVYVRANDVQGVIVGGSITTLADGGPISYMQPTSGSVGTPGEVDEWTFYGRADQSVSLFADPAAASSAALGRIQVELLAPDGSILATETSSTTGEVVSLFGVPLESDGTYRIRVRSALSGATGHYGLTLFESTVTTSNLLLNQPTVGTLVSPYNVHEWTFLADANDQVQFDLVNTNSNVLRFSLAGPNGYIGFSNSSTDSDFLNLPTTGEYTLTVTTDGSDAGSYSFALKQSARAVLTLGEPYDGTLSGSNSAQLFEINIAASSPLVVHFESEHQTDRVEVYLSRGTAPTRRTYQYGNTTIGAEHEIIVPSAAAGTWYILVYGESVLQESEFSLLVQSASFRLSRVGPETFAAGPSAEITLSGVGFLPGIAVEFQNDDGETYPASFVTVSGFDQATAAFDLSTVPVGQYDVIVRLPDGTTSSITDAFEVTPFGTPNLETRLILPSAMGRHALATIYVEYANTGTAAMPAPILILQSADPDDSDRPLLTLDQSRLAEGFWTSAVPDGFAHSVQIYASGANTGLLLPGERIRIPVYYAGLLQPWDFSDSQNEFEIRIHEAGDATPIDWQSLKSTLQPDGMATDAWEAVVTNLQDQIGLTWGDYVNALNNNAVFLSRLGQDVTAVNELFAFEFQQAVGLNPLTTLDAAIDIAVPVPGLALSLGRTIGNSITDRYAVGPFGRGWTSTWDVSLELLADGTVVVHEPGNNQRRFQPDSRYAGAYFSQEGDTGTLTRLSGAQFVLQESNGTITRFTEGGNLLNVQDADENRITATYADGRLSILSHSNGAWISLGYNAAGLIATVSDSIGRTVAYAYDASSTHLLSVSTPAGTTTYSYVSGVAAASEHALASVADSSGITRFFEYDGRGRLTSTYLTGDELESVEFAYDEAGQVTVTDSTGGTSSLFFDHRGLNVRNEDGLGNYVLYEYNDNRQLIRETNALGQSRVYTWCGCGTLSSLTDELDQTITFGENGLSNQPLSFTDARGNTTRYEYDASGNLTATRYVDGSRERVVYDAQGNPVTFVNRRGQAIQFAYNEFGQITQEILPEGLMTVFTYDNEQRLSSATDAQGATSYTYDDSDRLTRVEYPNGRWLEYEYDTGGRRTRIEDHNGFGVTYGYDSAGRLAILVDTSHSVIVAYTYDSVGRLAREDKGNGTWSEYTYDASDRTVSIVHYASSGSVNSRIDYTYDSLGRRTEASTLNGKWSYAYDLAGQLIHAVFNSTNLEIAHQDLTYEYDAAGNRLRTIANGSTTEYSVNGLDEYTTAGTSTLSYDLDGNLIGATGPDGSTKYEYDALSRLAYVETPNSIWEYEYDAFGNRTAVVENGVRTEFLLDPTGLANLVAEYDEDGVQKTVYAYGLGLEGVHQGDVWRTYDFDAIGSTVGVTSGGTGYDNYYAYTPFGRKLSESEVVSNEFEFVGQFGLASEDNGLIYARARNYSTEYGRFYSADPIGLAGGHNRYSYADNSPTNAIDPTGLWYIDLNFSLVYGLFVGAGLGVVGGPATTLGLLISNKGLFAYSGGGFGISEGVGLGYGGGVSAAVTFSANDPVVGNNGVVQLCGGACVSGGVDPNGEPFYEVGFGDFGAYAGNVYVQKLSVDVTAKMLSEFLAELGFKGAATTAQSIDPNEKYGASGIGDVEFITEDVTIPYKISFENLGPGSIPTPTQPATAPAQRVEITDELSTDLDWTTLRFTEAGFGDTLIAIPSDRQYFFTTASLTHSGQTFDVEVELLFDSANGIVRAVFQSIDPETQLPPDVLRGFLLPEDGTGRGQGYVSFTIQPKAGLPSGTELRNVASIRFDNQTTITTNQVDPQDPAAGTDSDREALNTIDAEAPTSNVFAPGSQVIAGDYELQWTGQDESAGSGIRSYDVFMSVDGGPFTLLLDDTPDTSATITVSTNTTYAFYTVATDNVGHVELGPATPDVTFTAVPPPLRVQQIIVNEGFVDRSNITQLDLILESVAGLQSAIDSGNIVNVIQIHGLTHQIGALSLTADHFRLNAAAMTLTIDLTVDGFGGSRQTFLQNDNYQLQLADNVFIDTDGLADSLYRFNFHRLAGDADGNRIVNNDDLFAILPYFGQYWDPADLNGDGVVDILDFSLIAGNFGQSL